ncbi:hypothetical protein C8R45DRAFT_987354, partial [Mycena sanguinolenta]
MTYDRMDHQVHSSSNTPDPVRRSKKCDTVRPKCNQCRLRPPKSLTPCYYPSLDPAHDHSQKTPAELVGTIRAVQERVQELAELLVDSDNSRVYLSPPYITTSEHALSVPGTLLVRIFHDDVFLERFAGSGYFFFDPVQFKQSTLLPFPFGHQDRPSPALLSAVYLWGSVLSDVPLHGPHTPDAFLTCVIQNIPQDLASSGVHSKLTLEILQAEVMLSLYFMRCTEPIQGRYHCAAAASLALGARLHLTGSPLQNNQSYPSFPMRASTTSVTTDVEAHAFEAVLIISNCWVAADGAPSPISCGILIDTPRPHGGPSLERLLGGADIAGLTSVAVLAKAGILLKRIIWFAESNASAPDLVMFSSLERRLLAFRAQLRPLPGDQVLILTHAHTDLALLRLHAPYSSTWEHSRFQALAACARITEGIKGLKRINLRHIDPVFAVCVPYFSDHWLISLHSSQSTGPLRIFIYPKSPLRLNLSELRAWLTLLAPHSPIFERCLVDMGMAVNKLPHQ